jgi:GNAT superfamily N-acetyltransferase
MPDEEEPPVREAEVRLRPARPDEVELMRRIDGESTEMYLRAGIDLRHFDDTHPFVQDERGRWTASARRGHAHFAVLGTEVVGFAVLAMLDGAPYLDQVSVRAPFMRRGIGRLLVAHAKEWSKPHGQLWLTTYSHLPWNGPYYQQAGFREIPERECGPEIRAVLEQQRAVMPEPEKRVAMVWFG